MIRAAVLALVAAAAPPAAAQPLPDFTLPAAARQTIDSADGPGLWPVAVGPAAADGAVPTLSVPGDRRRSAWLLAPGVATPLAVLQGLQDQIAAAGWEVRLACAAPVCGGYEFRHALDVLPLPDMYVDLSDYLYLSATPTGGDGAVEALLSLSSRGLHVQLSRIAPEPAATDAPVPTTAAPTPRPPPPPAGIEPLVSSVDARSAVEIGAALTRDGRVILEGLVFGSGLSTVPEDGVPSLDALAEWLSQDRTRRVAVVGHSDWTGGLAGNTRLSAARAKSVADWLIARRGVAPAQLESHGAGYLVPLTSNATAAGQTVNRRVEAVLLPPG